MHICRRAFILAALVSLFLAPTAQTSAAEKHSLWRVQGERCTVHLLGSVHLLRKSDYPLAREINTAYSNAAIVAFETDIAALDHPATAMKLMERGQLPGDQSLDEVVTPATYKAWTNYVRGAGLDPSTFDRFTPAMAGITAALIQIQKLGLDPSMGVDKHFFKLAQESGRKIVPLETVEFQVRLVSDFSKEEGELLLKTYVEQAKNLGRDLDDILRAWKTGDDKALATLLNDAMQESPAIYKRLLTDRNRNWLPQVEQLLRGRSNAIVIVGAGHLVGKDGVVDLLRTKGYKITQE
jgi:uncharacterized protein